MLPAEKPTRERHLIGSNLSHPSPSQISTHDVSLGLPRCPLSERARGRGEKKGLMTPISHRNSIASVEMGVFLNLECKYIFICCRRIES